MTITIHPLDRVELDGVSISLGMDRSSVEAAIGAGESFRGRSYYYNGEMAVDYSPDERVSFIEFQGGPGGQLRPFICGVSVFDENVDRLAELLCDINGERFTDNEHGHFYGFANIGIGLYREITPSEVLEMTEEMKAGGIPVENNPDLEADKIRADHWAAVGAGSADYYRT